MQTLFKALSLMPHYLHHALWAILGMVLYIISINMLRVANIKDELKRSVLGMCLFIGIVLSISGITWIEKALGLAAMHNLMGALIVGIGLGAWAFKKQWPGWYGFVEIVFAFESSLAVARDMTEKHEYFVHTATLCGCVYVVSRGIGNLEDALARRRKRGLKASKAIA